MKIFLGVLIFGIIAAGIFLFIPKTSPPPQMQQATNSPLPLENQAVDFMASFTIITHGTTRDFSAARYHNQSNDVYIDVSDPSVIYVKKAGITWNDFFQTLPMSVTKDCLITGTKQTFCTGTAGTLKFYLNNTENPNFLDEAIKPGDQALIQFIK